MALVVAALSAVPAVIVAVAGLVTISGGTVQAVRYIRRQWSGSPLDLAELRKALRRVCVNDLNELTGDTKPIDLPFRVIAHGVSVHGPHGSLTDIAALYEAEPTGRLVILGSSGAGKTALALQLQLELLGRWSSSGATPIPVRVSMSSWPEGANLRECVGTYMRDAYQVDADAAIGALEAGEIALVLDGLDEMDRSGPDAIRATEAIERINSWELRGRVPVIVTCQSRFYRELSERLVDACEIEVEDLSNTLVRDYLEAHPAKGSSWSEVVSEIGLHPDGVLAMRLRVPWWLNTAVAVCAPTRRAETNPASRLAPRELVDLARRGAFERRLMSSFVEVKQERMKGWWQSSEKWLGRLARYLDDSQTAGLKLDGQPLGGPDIIVHRLWPFAGERRVLNIDSGLSVVMSAPGLWWIGQVCFSVGWPGGALFLAGLIPYGAALRRTSRAQAIPPKRIHLRRLVSPAGFLQTLPPTLVLGVGGVLDYWTIGAAAAFALWIALGLTLGVSQALVQQAEVNPVEPDRLLGDELVISLVCAAAVLPLAMLYLADKYGPALGCPLAFAYCLLVGLTVASAPWRRYIALLLASRRRLPWRLRRFLFEAHKVGLLRRAGIAYQFRHHELQRHLAESTDGFSAKQQTFRASP